MGLEAKEPEKPEHVLGDTFLGPADESHPARLEITQPAKGIVNRPIRVGEQGVDGEVAPRRIPCPVVGKRHPGTAAEGLNVNPKGRNLEMILADHGGHGAVVDAGGNGMDPRIGEAEHDFLGRMYGGDVDVLNGTAKNGVANAAANEPRRRVFGAECRKYRTHRGGRHPRLGRNGRRRFHGPVLGPSGTTRPGTILPSFRWGA